MLEPSLYREIPPGFNLDDNIRLLKEEFQHQAAYPPRADFYISNFSEEMVKLLDDPFIQQSLSDYLIHEYKSRDNVPPQASYGVNFIFRAVQKQFLFNSDKAYPKDFDALVFSEEIPKVFLGKYPYDSDTFYSDLMIRKTQTNKWERYRGLWIPLQIARDSYDSPPTILDIGCGVNNVLKRLKKDELEYDLEHAEQEASKYAESLGDEIAAQLIGKLAVGRSIGVDMFNMYEYNVKQWAASCSLEPLELLDPNQVIAYHSLHSEVDGVEFRHLNYANAHPRNFRYPHLAFDETFDVVNASFVFEQSSQKDTDQMVENGKKQLKESGLFVAQGYIKPKDDNPGELVAVDNWHAGKFNCVTLVYEQANPDRGFQEVLRWYDGRMRQVQPGADLEHFRKRFTR